MEIKVDIDENLIENQLIDQIEKTVKKSLTSMVDNAIENRLSQRINRELDRIDTEKIAEESIGKLVHSYVMRWWDYDFKNSLEHVDYDDLGHKVNNLNADWFKLGMRMGMLFAKRKYFSEDQVKALQDDILGRAAEQLSKGIRMDSIKYKKLADAIKESANN